VTLLSLLQRSAEKFGNRTALFAGDRSMSYGELWESVVRVGGALRHLGVARGDRVGVMLPNVPAFIEAYFGILAAGATVVPFNTQTETSEFFILGVIGPVPGAEAGPNPWHPQQSSGSPICP
jgi:acyl-CoA synthetase (AMP-forming)/AMP-acid ligase II